MVDGRELAQVVTQELAPYVVEELTAVLLATFVASVSALELQRHDLGLCRQYAVQLLNELVDRLLCRRACLINTEDHV